MNLSIDAILDMILEHEGGLVEHLDDPGGTTAFGISQRAYPTLNIKSLSREQAKQIYLDDYLNGGISRLIVEHHRPILGFILADFAVNSGKGRAIRALQQLLGLHDDGIIGPKTLRAIESRNEVGLAIRLTALRLEFLTKLQGWKHFGAGWTRRNVRNLEIIAEAIES
jgi:lysozyme family protein